MSEREEIDHIYNPIKERAFLILIAAIVGTGGNALYREIKPPAPDRFTGTQAEAYKNQASQRFIQHEVRMDKLEIGFTNHDTRITGLETLVGQSVTKLDTIITGLHKVELEIAKLPPPEWRRRIRSLEDRIPEARSRD